MAHALRTDVVEGRHQIGHTMSPDRDVSLEAAPAGLSPAEMRGVQNGAIALRRPQILGLVALWMVSLVLDVGCNDQGAVTNDGGGPRSQMIDCHGSCPGSFFDVVVPADREDDVASVISVGPCRWLSVTGAAPGVYVFSVTDDGVCKVTVSFRSGAPDFVGSVTVAPNAGPCCIGQPAAQIERIDVPDLGAADASSGN
jgi:hypothetical protein